MQSEQTLAADECSGRNCWRSEKSKEWCKRSEKEGRNKMIRMRSLSSLNKWMCPPAPSNPRWIRGLTAGHQAFMLKYIHSFSGPRLYKLFSGLVYLHMLSLQRKTSRRCVVWACVCVCVCAWGGWVRKGMLLFGSLIMPTGSLREAFGDASAHRSLLDFCGAACLLSGSQASPTEPIPCWLATVKTPSPHPPTSLPFF